MSIQGWRILTAQCLSLSVATAMPAAPPTPPGELRILAWMCAIIAVNQLGFGAILPVLPLFAQSFGVSASAIGMTIAVYGLARFLSAMPCGRLADQVGRRPTLALGGLITALGNAWCAYASSFTEFMLARFVAGAGAGIVLTIGSVILADISTPARRGRMMAVYQAVFLFAVGIGPLPGGLLAEHLGLAAPFELYAIAAVVVTIIAWFGVPETRGFGRDAASSQPLTDVSFARQVRLLTANTGFLLICLFGFTHAVVRTGGLFNIVPVIGATELQLSASRIGAALAIGSVLGLFAAYPAGMMADRFGRKPVIVPSCLLVGVAMAGFAYATSFTGFALACVAWGIATSISGAAPAAYAADSAPPGMNAAAMSSYRMLSDLGYVVGPIGLGLLVDYQGTDTTLIVSATMIVAVGLLFAHFAPETWRAAGGLSR